MSFLADLKASAFSEWLLVSMLGFPTLIALHSVGMAVVVGLSLMVALRLNGFFTVIEGALVRRFLTVAAWGFVLNLLTGLALFMSRGPEYIVSYMFLVKMLLVLTSATILFWLRQRLGPQTEPEALVTDGIAKNMSLVASVAWFGAVVAGRLIAYLSDLYR